MTFNRFFAAALLAGGTMAASTLSVSAHAPDPASQSAAFAPVPRGVVVAHHEHHADHKSRYVVREKIRPEKLRKPRTGRHDHIFKVRGAHHGARKTYILKGVTHRHDGYLPHTHPHDDFIHISPEATRWPVPSSTRGMLETLPLPVEAIETAGLLPATLAADPLPVGVAPDLLAPDLLAHVVFSKENGVTVIRNANTVIAPGLPIVDERLIGNTELPVPRLFFSVEDLEFCNRRLRTVSSPSGQSIRIGEARYCE